ncbi:four-helix bundle copper-binding protein [Actinophytocola sp.]|uniref:four-helix bundle copper-binding protein n=1 Tax=Actinophytocola sp. TaxID=1872138 RepID=UPI002ED4EB0D
MTTTTMSMLETHPAEINVDRGKLAVAIDALIACAETCTSCADACLSEKSVADLTKCIRANMDCADVCEATARVLSRHTGYDANISRALLAACVTVCGSCGDECGSHAAMHEHCRVCAEACRNCEQACRDLLAAIG